MSRPPSAFLAQLSRAQLVEMMTPSYAKAKNLDPNDAYRRLENALRDLELIEGLQYATWHALEDQLEDEAPEAIVERVRKKMVKKKRFKAATWKTTDEGAWTALGILIDRGAGVASGEALDLLETDAGQKLLDDGLAQAGRHLAKELTR